MAASHIAVARESGMKAGLRAYEDSLKRSGLPTVLAKAVEVLSMPAKQRFEWYCAQFGADVGVRESVSEVSEIDALRARIAELEGKSTPAQRIAATYDAPATPAAPAKLQPKATKITFPMAMVIKRYATKTGESFEFTAKHGKNSYGIAVNGRNLTPAQASALIARIKQA